MADNLGQILYSDLCLLPAPDTTQNGSGNLSVAGNTIFVGTSNRMTGTLKVDSDATFSSNVYVSGMITSGAGLSMDNDATFYKSVYLLSTTDSTSSSTGSMILDGGLGVQKNTNVGGSFSVTGSATLGSTLSVAGNSSLSGVLTVSNTTETTSSGVGSIISSGGITAAKSLRSDLGNLYMGGDLVLSTNPTSGVVALNGVRSSLKINTAGEYNVYVNSGSSVDLNISDGVVVANQAGLAVHSTAESSSSSSGALIVDGGVGVAKTLNVGENIVCGTGTVTAVTMDVTGTTNSTSTSSGSIITSGGIGVVKNAYIGGSLDVATVSGTKSNIGSIQITTDSNGSNWISSGDASRTEGSWETLKLAPYGSTTTSLLTVGTNSISVDLSTESSSNTTGAVVISGGLAVTKKINAASDVNIGGNLSVTGNLSSANGISFSNTTQSTSTSTGAVTTPGGVGIGKDLYVGGIIHSTSTTESTSTTTGSTVISGGLGVTGNANVGGYVNVGSTAASTTTSTGALVVGGGIGVAGNANVGGSLTVNSVTDSTSVSTGAAIIKGGVGIASDVFVGGTVNVTGEIDGTTAMFTGAVSVTNTTQASSSTTGSVTISGGVGIGKKLYVGDTTVSSDTTSGAVVITGGVGIGGALNVGGNGLMNMLILNNKTDLGPPTVSTRSSGTRIVLEPAVSSSQVDFAMGVDATNMWMSLPDGTTKYKWYSGTTGIADLTGNGVFTLYGATESTNSGTGTLVVGGGAGIQGNTNVGGGLFVTGTSSFHGAMTCSSNETVTGLLSVANTTNSSSAATGAIITTGGLGVALDANVGGSLTIGNDLIVTDTLSASGVVQFYNTTDSSAVGNGALLVDGGASVSKALNIGGNLTVTGNTTFTGDVFFNGSKTSIDSQTLEVKDNIALVNSGPSGIMNSGYAMKRYMTANNAGTGSLISETPFATGTAQTGGSSTTVVMNASSSSVDDAYAGMWIFISAGTGQNQVRRIKSYVGSTKIATIYSTADETANPQTPTEGLDFATVLDSTSVYNIYNDQYVITVFDESTRKYVLASTMDNPSGTVNVPIENTIDVKAGSLTLDRSLVVNTIASSSGSGVNVENVIVKSGAFDDVASINGTAIDYTSQVTLNDTTNVLTQIPGSRTSGAFLVLAQDVNNTGANAVFVVSGTYAHGGVGQRIATSSGANGESLDIQWSAGDYPKLHFLTTPTSPTGANYTYNTRVTRV